MSLTLLLPRSAAMVAVRLRLGVTKAFASGTLALAMKNLFTSTTES